MVTHSGLAQERELQLILLPELDLPSWKGVLSQNQPFSSEVAQQRNPGMTSGVSTSKEASFS